MVKKRIYKVLAIAALIVTLLGCGLFAYYDHIREVKMNLWKQFDYYDAVIRSEQKWISDLQLSNGALPFRSSDDGAVSVIPYFSDISAIALIQRSSGQDYLQMVKKYFDWHFSKLNSAEGDMSGIAGTIFDYEYEMKNGAVISEKTDKEYDSVDSYAALFLCALSEYYDHTGDIKYLLSRYSQITEIVGAMVACVDIDGLSIVKPTYPIKYLMDNTEVYQGMIRAIDLFEKIYLLNFKKDTPEYYEAYSILSVLRAKKEALEQAFENILWNEDEQRYETGIDNGGAVLEFHGWSEFYPDAVAQLFPIAFGVISPESERAQHLYDTFSEHFNWESMDYLTNGDASFYWGLIAYCGALMGDEERVTKYLNFYIRNVIPDHNYPLYNADAAWIVMTGAHMASYYEDLMKKEDPLGLVSIKQ